MLATHPNLPQWSELGEQLSGPDGDTKRSDVITRLDAIEARANAALRAPACPDPARVEALLHAIGHARDIASRVFKPVDLSAL